MTIKLSEINNLSNEGVTKSGQVISLERILNRIYNGGKGRVPTYYYNGEKVIVDIKKCNIEHINYCDRCMIYVFDSDGLCKCPKCNNEISFYDGYKLINKHYYLYSDKDYNNCNKEYKINKGNRIYKFNIKEK